MEGPLPSAPDSSGPRSQHRSRMLLDSTTDSEDVFRAPMVFRRSRASRESPPTLTSSLWLPEARVTAGQGACQESQCGGAGARSRQRSRPGPQRRFSHPALLRGGPVAAVGLQGQRVDPRRRWHNWKNRGGNSAGGCVRDGAHCGRSTARRSGGGWCRRRSRGPSPARTARPAAAERGASPGAPGSAPEQRRGVGAEPPPPRLPAPAQGRASPAGLTRFFISKAWMAGS